MRKRAFVLVLVFLLPVIAGCGASGAEPAAAESIALVDTSDLLQMASITLSGTTASVEGGGVAVDGATVTITAGGVYTLSGALNGQIVIDAGKKDTVELVLDGVSVTSPQSAAFYSKQAGLTVVTLAEGSENVLSDASEYQSADDGAAEPGAALYAKGGLTIRGAGSLTVHGNAANGICTKDSLVIEGGTIAVQAANHGLHGKDSVTVLGGGISIAAGGDGIQSDNVEDAGSGTILIAGGTLDINAAHDGMQAETGLTVSGGSIGILSGGGYAAGSCSGKESYKGLKSAGTIGIAGGGITVNSLDDAIHAGVAASVSGGTLSLMSGDDGIHADDTVNLTGGTVNILASFEGIEGAVVNIEGGVISMTAVDDGINAVDTTISNKGHRMDPVSGWGETSDGSLQVNISGGTVTINANGDGIDSNGVINMSGGALYISGPVTYANSAIDYNGSFILSGGVLVAAGSSGMAKTPSQDSVQPSVILWCIQPQAAGPFYILADDGGNALAAYQPDKEFKCILFSAPELSIGGTYRIYKSADGTIAGAPVYCEFTLSGTITSVSETYGQDRPIWQAPPEPQ